MNFNLLLIYHYFIILLYNIHLLHNTIIMSNFSIDYEIHTIFANIFKNNFFDISIKNIRP